MQNVLMNDASSTFEFADLCQRVEELAGVEDNGQKMAQLALQQQGKP